jgi:hypothetical protein
MKTLYNYISESLLNNVEDSMQAGDTYAVVKEWLEENYNVNRCTYDIVITKNDCVVNVNGDIRMEVPMRGQPDRTALTNGMFRFGTVNGNFDANYQSLKNLEGSPRVVTGKFTIDRPSKVKRTVDGIESFVDTLLFDIKLDNEVPNELRMEFEVPEGVDN